MFYSSSAGLARIFHEKDSVGAWQVFVSKPFSRRKSYVASRLATSEGTAANFSRVRTVQLFSMRVSC